jgi:transposase
MIFTINKRAKKLEQRRLSAGRYFERGKSQAWVADHFKVTPAAVCKWYARWQEDKQDGLKSIGRCGAPAKLTKETLRKVDTALLRGPEKNGFSSPLWTLERATQVIRKETRVAYHPGHVWKVLHFLGWTNQRPVRRARERNEAAIRVWKKDVWPALQKKGSAAKQPLVSMMKPAFPIVP